MKLNRKLLLTALKAVKPGLGKSNEIDQATKFVFMEGMVCTYNDEVAVSHPLEVDFNGAVPGKEFYGAVDKLKTEEVELVVTGGELLVKGGQSKTIIRIESEITLPIIDLGMPEDDEYNDLPETFAEAVSSCLFSVGKDQNKPLLTCLHVKGTRLESSDNQRVTRFEMGKKAKGCFPDELLIPAHAAKSIIDYKPVEYAVTDGWLHFRNADEAMFSCRVFEDEYPDFTEYLKEEGKEITFPDNLSEILDRAVVICDNDNKRVTVSLAANKLTISAEGVNGKFNEAVRVKYDGAGKDFDIHPEFMRTIMRHNKTAIIGKLLHFKTENFQHVVNLLPSMKK